MFLIPDDAWEIRDTKVKGKGIFAKKDIAAGTVIGDYIGRIIKTAEEDDVDNKAHFYLMYYHDRASIYPDLTKPGIHLINHACTPNVWMYTYRGHTLYFALRHIFPEEELTVAYLLSPQDEDCKPCTHLCKCGAILCLQTMHLSDERYDAWRKFDDEMSLRTKREKITYGKMLPPLDTYPESIPDNPIYTLFGAQNHQPTLLEDSSVPSKKRIREVIRETGKTIRLPQINLYIHGILDNLMVTTTMKD